MVTTRSLLQGRYRIVRKLGEGGMAIVYLGHDLELGRDVAIKTLRPQFAADPAFRARFQREAHAAASLSHPNIIDVHDVGESEGVPYLVMELIRGHSLKEIIAADAPFHPDDVAELIEQIGGALDYAHTRGYIHRDVKPGNILVDEHGRARVVDFGIAKGLFESDLTITGVGLGTVGYLAPEQAEGLMATPASDVYSSGVVAFEMLTGRLPFQAETPVGVAMQHVNEPAPPPSSLQAGVPPQIDAIVLRALEKDPTRRWPSMGAFAKALRQWRELGAPPSPPRPLVSRAQRQSSSLPTIIVMVLVIAALAALLWAGYRILPDQSWFVERNVHPPGPNDYRRHRAERSNLWRRLDERAGRGTGYSAADGSGRDTESADDRPRIASSRRRAESAGAVNSGIHAGAVATRPADRPGTANVL